MEPNDYLPSPFPDWSHRDAFRAEDVDMMDFPLPTQLSFSSAVQISDPLAINAARQQNTVTQDQDPPRRPTGQRASRRLKYTGLDWDHHKPQLKRIYLDENKSLSETIAIMRDQYSFDAS
jgi:hypothetical protein